jgi:hypothetical protein
MILIETRNHIPLNLIPRQRRITHLERPLNRYDRALPLISSRLFFRFIFKQHLFQDVESRDPGVGLESARLLPVVSYGVREAGSGAATPEVSGQYLDCGGPSPVRIGLGLAHPQPARDDVFR